MSGANSIQHGGIHYRLEYQHWDWATDVGMHYLIGCATKYITRWRKKNGVEDLNKAIHYLQKAQERRVTPMWIWTKKTTLENRNNRFINQFQHSDDKMALAYVMTVTSPDYTKAIEHIKQMISRA